MSDRKKAPKAESSGSSKEPRGNFEFVSVVPTKDGRAKPNRQAVVRKNAARYQWRKTKSEKAPARKPVVARTDGNDGLVVVKDEGEPGDKKKVTGPGYGLHGSRLALQTYYLSFAEDEKVAKVMTFSRFTCVEHRLEASLTIHVEGSRVILPAIMPSSKPNVDHAGNKALVQMICNDALLFLIWEYHTEIHFRFKFGRPLVEDCDFLLLYGEIIKSLNERMRGKADTACSDASILCVLGVTTYGTLLAKPLERTRWPSQGPLMNLNALDTLGRLPSVLEHLRGLDLLIGLRGGIHSIKTPGIAPMVSM